ncbi:MAG: HAD family hydrolase [Candidatus Bathyarchaeota archaeon]|nr:HAD family hydrolase [Candidatus Bathyarchaeota archaeon]
MKTKIISFDVEGTLISHRFSEIVWEKAIPHLYSEKKGIDFDSAKSFVFNEYKKIGEDRIEWYDINYWFNRFGLTNYKNLLKQHAHEIFIYPEVQQVLDELGKYYMLIINSNSAREFLELEISEIKSNFSHIFSAPSDFKQTKKSTLVYSEICKFLKVKPKEMVHIGDNWAHDFIAPRKIGIVSFLLDRTKENQGENIVHDLKQFHHKIMELENKLDK